MSLVKWKNEDFFPAFYEMMDGFLSTRPAVNIAKTDKNYQVEVAVPGLNKSDFTIRVENGILNISAEQEHAKTDKDEHYTRKEFSYRSFRRTFHLPDDADEQGIGATYENGLLKINIPLKAKATDHSARKITIQ